MLDQENPTKTALMLIKDDLLETLYHLGFEQVEPNVFLRSEEVYGSIKFSVSDDGNSIVATMYWSDGNSQCIKTYPFFTSNNPSRRG